jgi:hypothetical protein
MTDTPSEPAPGWRVKPRVVALLAVLAAVICASVIATNHFSKRPRTHEGPAGATQGVNP